VPSAYLKDEATEDQKIGLLLGMAGELHLPLAGVIDMASAALCDPLGPGLNPVAPVVIVVDMHLSGADLSLHVAEDGRFVRREFSHVAAAGYAPLLKHLTAAMGNRFLKHTAFDIQEDGQIEQTFYRQTRDFMMSGAADCLYQINTARRAYEMTGTHGQLIIDAMNHAALLVQGVQALAHKLADRAEPVTVALTTRAAMVPGLESRLRAAGFTRLHRLAPGAAAAGAAFIGATRLQVQDLAEIPVDTAVALTEVKRSAGTPWEAQLHKVKAAGTRPPPTHVVIEGIGAVTIGSAGAFADLALPEAFNAAADCLVQLQRDDGRLWFVDPGAAPADAAVRQVRTALESGDRLVLRCGTAAADLLFIHCPDHPRTRA
jgi:hypothetical protein